MTDKAVKREFSFTDREAGIVARCELGVGDLPRRLSLMLGATAAATVALRAARKMPLPSFALLGCYAAAVTAWVVFLVYLDRRLKLTAADVASRTLGLYWSGEGMELYDYAGQLRYRAEFPQVETVERGDLVCRISSPMGRVCVPLRLLSASELQALDGLEQAKHTRRSWM